jgi:hypothetical protein
MQDDDDDEDDGRPDVRLDMNKGDGARHAACNGDNRKDKAMDDELGPELLGRLANSREHVKKSSEQLLIEYHDLGADLRSQGHDTERHLPQIATLFATNVIQRYVRVESNLLMLFDSSWRLEL